MHFQHSDRALEWQDRLKRFMDARVLPAAADYWAEVRAEPNVQPPTMERLKAEEPVPGQTVSRDLETLKAKVPRDLLQAPTGSTTPPSLVKWCLAPSDGGLPFSAQPTSSRSAWAVRPL